MFLCFSSIYLCSLGIVVFCLINEFVFKCVNLVVGIALLVDIFQFQIIRIQLFPMCSVVVFIL